MTAVEPVRADVEVRNPEAPPPHYAVPAVVDADRVLLAVGWASSRSSHRPAVTFRWDTGTREDRLRAVRALRKLRDDAAALVGVLELAGDREDDQ